MTWPKPCAPKSLWTDAIASMPTCGARQAGGCTASARARSTSASGRLLEHSVETLPQEHEDELDHTLAWHVAVLVPPGGHTVACRLRGAGQDPRRFVDGD